jgi:hypothetical protein
MRLAGQWSNGWHYVEMRYVSWSSGQSRAFVFTLDALLSFSIVIGFTSVLFLALNQDENLNRECLYALAQDVMEVCSEKADFSEGCFDVLNATAFVHYALFKNGAKEFGEDGAAQITIARHYPIGGLELRVWS